MPVLTDILTTNTQSFPLCYMYKEVDLLSDSCHPKSVVTDVECNYTWQVLFSFINSHFS